MHIHPLPTPLRIGTDIVHIPRITSFLGRSSSRRKFPTGLDDKIKRFEHLARKVLTPRERKAFDENKAYSIVRWEAPKAGAWSPKLKQYGSNRMSWLAGRFAAKEAVIKAVKPRRLFLRDMEIWSDKHGEHFALISTFHTPTRDNETNEQLSSSAHNAFTSGDYAPEKLQLLKYPKASKVEFGGDGSVISGLEGCFEDEDGLEGKEGREEAKQLARVSISHDGEYATAVALAVGMPVVNPR